MSRLVGSFLFRIPLHPQSAATPRHPHESAAELERRFRDGFLEGKRISPILHSGVLTLFFPFEWHVDAYRSPGAARAAT